MLRTVLLLTPLLLLEPVPGRADGPAHDTSPTGPAPETVERTRYLMGTRLSVRLEARDRARGLAASEAVFVEVARLEATLSTWDPASLIGLLNTALVDRPVEPDAELLGVLLEAEGWAVATGRAFDPTVGALVDAWDLRGAGRVPSPAVLAEALNAVGGSAFSLDAAAGTVTRHHRRAWIDTGSFGKGAALRSVRRVLEGHGVRRAVVDFGGQLLVVGGAEEARGEEVLVAHPRHRDSPVCRLVVRDASVSTTSNSERFLVVEGEELGHVIDPRSGRLSPSWGSVSVVSRDPLAADALSTALFVMGPEEGARWASTLTDIGVLFLEAGDGAPIPTWNAALERSLADPARPCVHEAIPEREDR